MSDTLKFENEEYIIAGIKGDELFNPEFLGITLYSRCTACWRGFTLYYEVVNQYLVLQGILFNTKDEPSPLNNKIPINAEEYFFDYLYENLDLKSDFSGNLLIANDFIQELYIHMGFQAPTSYKNVLELIIEDGKIISFEDKSEEMEYLRNHERNEDEKTENVQQWIEEKFSLDY
jgi:hypothetical protein